MDNFSGDESIPVIDLKDIGLIDNNLEGKCKSSNEIKLAKKVINGRWVERRWADVKDIAILGMVRVGS